MKRLSLILSLYFALISLSLSAQVVVSPDFAIFPSTASQSEVHISINKSSPANILASANTRSNAGVFSQSYYYSLDGGVTWSGSDQLPDGGTGDGDPSTGFDASGRAYLTTMTTATDGYWVQHSDDRGVDWSAQARGVGPITGGDFDKEMMVTVDEMQTSPYANYFYCAWTDFDPGNLVKVNRSTDRTNTFSAAITVSAHYGQGTSLQTGPNGEVYVAWADYTNGSIPAQNLGFAVSLDGGATYTSSLPFAYAGIRTNNGGLPAFNNSRVNDFPVLAVDKSCGAHRGRIYVVYPIYNGAQAVIQIRSSDNHGTTWTAPTTISIPGGHQNWFPWVAVDDLTGLVNVAYYSMDVSPTSFATDTYVAYSTDGGATWQNVKVSAAAHTTAPIGLPGLNPVYAGDYIGISSFGGVSYVAWGDSRTGNWQIYSTKVNYNIPTLSSSQSNLSINAPGTISGSEGFQAFTGITVSNTSAVTIASGANVTLTAGNNIILDPGFNASNGSTFHATIASVSACTTPGAIFYSAGRDTLFQQESNIFRATDSTNLKMFAYPNPTAGMITIGCLNQGYNNIYLQIYDASGRLLGTQEASLIDATQARFVFDASQLTAGMYFFTIITDGVKHSGEFLKVSKE